MGAIMAPRVRPNLIHKKLNNFNFLEFKNPRKIKTIDKNKKKYEIIFFS